MTTPEFGEAFERLLELCERGRTCLMCSEAVWWRCHRRMISDALVVRGVVMEHILAGGRRQPHQLTLFVEVVDEGRDKRLVYPAGKP